MIDNEGARPLAKLVASLSAAPSPHVSLSALVPAAYRASSSRIAALSGVLLGGLLVAGGFFTEGRGTSIGLVVSGVLVLVVLCTAPLVAAVRMRAALSRGSVVQAVVLSVEVSEWRGIETLDALTHGFVAGRVRVEAESASWEARFESDATWGRRVVVGDRLVGLADPARRRVYAWLGRVMSPRRHP